MLLYYFVLLYISWNAKGYFSPDISYTNSSRISEQMVIKYMRLKCVSALRWFPQATEWRAHVECALNHSHLLNSTVSRTSFSSLSLGPGVLALRSCALVTDDIYKGFSVRMLIQRWPPPCPEIHIHQDMKGYNLSCISSSAHFLIRSYISLEL